MTTVACCEPVGTASVYQLPLPPTTANLPPAVVVNTPAVVTPVPHVNVPLAALHLPLDDVKVNPPDTGAAVKVAHVPVVYHVPPEMMQPFVELPDVTGRVPLPENVPEVDVGAVVVEVVVGGGEEVLGRYLMPVAGQLDLEPSRVDSC